MFSVRGTENMKVKNCGSPNPIINKNECVCHSSSDSAREHVCANVFGSDSAFECVSDCDHDRCYVPVALAIAVAVGRLKARYALWPSSAFRHRFISRVNYGCRATRPSNRDSGVINCHDSSILSESTNKIGRERLKMSFVYS